MNKTIIIYSLSDNIYYRVKTLLQINMSLYYNV
jgi:hypothetical protein